MEIEVVIFQCPFVLRVTKHVLATTAVKGELLQTGFEVRSLVFGDLHYLYFSPPPPVVI